MYGRGQASAVPYADSPRGKVKDTMCPQFHAKYFKENIRGSEMVIMEEGKHNLHLRYAKEFNRLVEQFLFTSVANIKFYLQENNQWFCIIIVLEKSHKL